MPGKDRLAEFQEVVAEDADETDRLSWGDLDQQNATPFMEQFFKDIEDIRSKIDLIVEDVESVKKKQSQILSNPVNDAAAKQELDEFMAEIKKTANAIRGKLKSIEHSLDNAEENDENSADFRIRKSQHSALMRKFVDVMQEYNKVQTDYRENCKGRMIRQMEISGKEVDEEQLETALETGDLGSVTQGIFANTSDAKQALADIEARHNDIMKLETSIKELHDMFMDMAMLVETQGEIIDRIEFNVEQSGGYVDRATGDIRKAGAYEAAARRKKLMMIVCVIVLVIVLIGVGGGMFMP